MPPAGQLLFWGRAWPGSILFDALGALDCVFRHLAGNPDFRPFRAFGDVQKVALGITRRGLPLPLAGLVGAGKIDGIEPIIVPDGGGDQAQLDLVGR